MSEEPESEPEVEIQALIAVFGDLHVYGDVVLVAGAGPTEGAVGAAQPADAPPDHTAAPAGAPAASSSSPAEGSLARPASGPAEEDWDFRIARAISAGASAAEKLAERTTHVDPTPKLSLRPRVYVLLRPGATAVRSGAPARARGAATTWAAIRPYVACGRDLGLDPRSVFHGFPSQAEAREYWHEATRLGGPIPALPVWTP